jgi:hypothetical protein
VFDKVTITYRGAKYEIGRGRDFYGIWIAGGPRSQPLEWWPETPEGWSAAWTRFGSIEAPGAIVPVGRRTPPVGASAVRVNENPGPFGRNTAPPGETAGETIVVAGGRPAPYGQFVGSYGQSTASYGPSRRVTRAVSGRTGGIAAAALLALGVIAGVAGLFPAYLGGSSLAQQADQLIPHAIYLAVWTAGAALILLGGTRLRLGALLSLGLSVVTFGLFFADAGTAIAGGGNTGGAGLVLALVGWLACAAGSVVAFLHRPADAPAAGQPDHQGSLARPRGAELGPVAMLVLAGLGLAAAFAPAWDIFTLRTAAGQSQSLTGGNAFSNPGLVIAGDVAVMLALAAVVVVAALWRPVRYGGVLLAGGVIAMAAQAISALVQAGGGASPAQFGISSAEASRIGLTISSGLTPAFWIYCGFLVAVTVSCAWMLFTPHPASGPSAAHDAYAWPAAPHDDLADEEPDDEGQDDEGTDDDAVTPDFETAPSRTAAAVGDGDSSAA